MAYDYKQAVKDDVLEYLDDNDIVLDGYSEDYWQEKLYDELWVEDSVTGNASGSYTFNTAQAKEYVEPNSALAMEAMTEFGYGAKEVVEKFREGEWEYLDVTIRCYLLGGAIAEALSELEWEDK